MSIRSFTRRFFCLTISVLLVLSLCGCSTARGDNTPAPTATSVPIDPALEAVPIPAAESFADGSGTEGDPYQIKTAEQLALLSKLCTYDSYHEMEYSEITPYLTAYYILTDDIQFNDISDIETWSSSAPQYEWTPIGTRRFSGTFDGNGHTISGMYIYSTYAEDGRGAYDNAGGHAGLFGEVSNGAIIRNLTVTDSLIHLTGKPTSAGGIASSVTDSALENCISGVQIITTRGSGGVVGEVHDSTIKNCDFTGSIVIASSSGMDNIGGIAGNVTGDSEL